MQPSSLITFAAAVFTAHVENEAKLRWLLQGHLSLEAHFDGQSQRVCRHRLMFPKSSLLSYLFMVQVYVPNFGLEQDIGCILNGRRMERIIQPSAACPCLCYPTFSMASALRLIYDSLPQPAGIS